MKLISNIHTSDDVLELIDCIQEHGWSDQLNFLFGEELSLCEIDTTDTDDEIVRGLANTYSTNEVLLDTIIALGVAAIVIKGGFKVIDILDSKISSTNNSLGFIQNDWHELSPKSCYDIRTVSSRKIKILSAQDTERLLKACLKFHTKIRSYNQLSDITHANVDTLATIINCEFKKTKLIKPKIKFVSKSAIAHGYNYKNIQGIKNMWDDSYFNSEIRSSPLSTNNHGIADKALSKKLTNVVKGFLYYLHITVESLVQAAIQSPEYKKKLYGNIPGNKTISDETLWLYNSIDYEVFCILFKDTKIRECQGNVHIDGLLSIDETIKAFTKLRDCWKVFLEFRDKYDPEQDDHSEYNAKFIAYYNSFNKKDVDLGGVTFNTNGTTIEKAKWYDVRKAMELYSIYSELEELNNSINAAWDNGEPWAANPELEDYFINAGLYEYMLQGNLCIVMSENLDKPIQRFLNI